MTPTTTRPRRRFLASLIVAASSVTLLNSPALAYDENSASAVNVDASGLQLQHLRERHAGDKENAVSRTPFLFATAAILAEPAGFAGDGASVVIFGLSEAFELAH